MQDLLTLSIRLNLMDVRNCLPIEIISMSNEPKITQKLICGFSRMNRKFLMEIEYLSTNLCASVLKK